MTDGSSYVAVRTSMRPDSHSGATEGVRGSLRNRLCERGDLNPHGLSATGS
jgi:hypothetical protein